MKLKITEPQAMVVTGASSASSAMINRLTDEVHRCFPGTTRTRPLIEKAQIREQMQVRGWDGQPVGKVDKLEGDRIKLANGNGALNHHQYIDLDAVWSVEGDVLCLDRTAEEAKRQSQQRMSENGGSGLVDL